QDDDNIAIAYAPAPQKRTKCSCSLRFLLVSSPSQKASIGSKQPQTWKPSPESENPILAPPPPRGGTTGHGTISAARVFRTLQQVWSIARQFNNSLLILTPRLFPTIPILIATCRCFLTHPHST